MDVLPHDPDLLRAAAASLPQDETFPRFARSVQARGAVVEIVSDGLGFYVPSNLARLGVADLPIATNGNAVSDGGAGMSFPYGHPRCFVCGTCKRERVFRHRGAGRIVVFIGDGTSDRYAAAHSDIVWAKGHLARMCATNDWPFRSWDRFSEIETWAAEAFGSGELPSSKADLAGWRQRQAIAPRPFICGPEVWGDGRTTPP